MNQTYERQLDILKIISNLDISPTMYKNAVSKYHALAQFLSDCGIDAEMYPQGSFAVGTVVRPVAKDPDASYDLDFICQVKGSRDTIAPSELRNRIQKALESSDRYGGKLHIYDECFTIEYADINGVGFQIDIVPAVDESDEIKHRLTNKTSRPDLIPTSIAIPKHNGERNYNWITNNPRGFKQWFDEINQPFIQYNRDSRRMEFFYKHRNIFSSVEEIPDELDRSSVQRVIQLLKYHRDTYYNSLVNGDDLKPISAIINTMVAQISVSAAPQITVFDLLQYVVNELEIYAKHLTMQTEDFSKKYGNRSVIAHDNGIWRIENPANPEDNLADSWNKDARIPRTFFKWLQICKTDLLDSLSLPDQQFRSSIENAFGINIVKKEWGPKYNQNSPKPIRTSSAAKPYRCDYVR